MVEVNANHDFVTTPPEPQAPDMPPVEPDYAPHAETMPDSAAPPVSQTEQVNIADL